MIRKLTMLSPLMKGHEDDGMFHEKVGSTIARLASGYPTDP